MMERLVFWKQQKSIKKNKNDASPYWKSSTYQLEKCDDLGQRPIHEACLSGDMIKARYLIDHGVDLNVLTVNGRSALHLATINQNVAMLTLLLRDEQVEGTFFRLFTLSINHFKLIQATLVFLRILYLYYRSIG